MGADGASSLVRPAFADTPMPQRYSAIQAEYETSSGDASYGAIFDATLTDFYGWTIPKGDALLIGAAFPAGPGVAARYDTFVERLRGHGMRFGTRLSLTSAMIARPTSLLHLCPGAGGILLAGEAAGFISPSSAEGISYALKQHYSSLQDVSLKNSWLTIGVFDGVHRGHQQIIHRMAAGAHEE